MQYTVIKWLNSAWCKLGLDWAWRQFILLSGATTKEDYLAARLAKKPRIRLGINTTTLSNCDGFAEINNPLIYEWLLLAGMDRYSSAP